MRVVDMGRRPCKDPFFDGRGPDCVQYLVGGKYGGIQKLDIAVKTVKGVDKCLLLFARKHVYEAYLHSIVRPQKIGIENLWP